MQYGDTWMREAIRAQQATDHTTRDPRQELSAYLTSPLENTTDIVAWWGVSRVIASFVSYLNHLLASLATISYPCTPRS